MPQAAPGGRRSWRFAIDQTRAASIIRRVYCRDCRRFRLSEFLGKDCPNGKFRKKRIIKPAASFDLIEQRSSHRGATRSSRKRARQDKRVLTRRSRAHRAPRCCPKDITMRTSLALCAIAVSMAIGLAGCQSGGAPNRRPRPPRHAALPSTQPTPGPAPGTGYNGYSTTGPVTALAPQLHRPRQHRSRLHGNPGL